MCNHKRTIPKTFEKSLEKKREGIKKAKNAKTKTKKQEIRKKERINRLKLQLDLVQKTRDYNSNASTMGKTVHIFLLLQESYE